jgi:Leucine-rich repeat (LRR) protein
MVLLESLNLGGNNLSGKIPSEIGQLTGLRKCDLGFNLLTGTIPTEIAALANLQSLRLRGIVGEVNNGRNEIMGTFPSGLGDLDKLTCFDASGTLLTGNIPESICVNTVNSTVFVNVRCVGIGSACSCCKCDAVDQCTLSL